MKLWEKLSGIIYKLISLPYLSVFKDNDPESVLKRSVFVMDTDALEQIRAYIRNLQTGSGAFPDKAGRDDLYYTLFGFYVTEALDMHELIPSVKSYLQSEFSEKHPTGVHLYCAAVLSAKTGMDITIKKNLKNEIRRAMNNQLNQQPAYTAFLTLLACYYVKDFNGIFLIKKQIDTFNSRTALPCPVLAALLVLRKSFRQPCEDITADILSFYDNAGGFRATSAAPVPDLLSTAVALYALHFAGTDLRRIKPDCLQFIESMYCEGGFSGNVLDTDTDIEYTFYGLLALGALSAQQNDRKENY